MIGCKDSLVPGRSNHDPTGRPVNTVKATSVPRGITKATRISDLQNKWEICIFNFSDKEDPGGLYTFKQLSRCNSLIGTTRRYLSNYECALLFNKIALKFLWDEEFVKSVLVLTVRWWFCWGFNVHLSQFPNLGNLAMLYNISLGLRSVFCIHGRYLLMLLEFHGNLDNILTGMMIYRYYFTSENNSNGLMCIDSCNKLLLKTLPILKTSRMCKGPREAVCVQVTKFVDQIFDMCLEFSSSILDSDGFVTQFNGENHTELDNLLYSLWEGAIKCYKLLSMPEYSCKCYGRIMEMCLELIVFHHLTVDAIDLSNNCKASACKDLLKRIIGFFAKWVMKKTNSNSLESSPIKPVALSLLDKEEVAQFMSTLGECVDGISTVDFQFPVCIKRENPDSECFGGGKMFSNTELVIESAFFRILARVLANTNNGVPVPKEFLVLFGTIISLDENIVLKSVEILKTSENVESLRCQMHKVPASRNSLIRIFGNSERYIHINEHICEHSTASELCECFCNLHKALCNAARVELHNVKEVFVMTSMFGNIDTDLGNSYVEFSIPRSMAVHLLHCLLKTLELSETTVANLPIPTCSFAKDFAERSKDTNDSPKPISALTCTVVALATILNDSITVMKCSSDSGFIQVFLRFRNVNFVPMDLGDIDLWQLLLRLLYLDISTDAAIALEYRNDQLILYRTVLVIYLSRVALLPTRSAHRIHLKCGGIVSFCDFMRRLFRLISFRVNSHLMDRNRFDNFIRTRVMTKREPDDQIDVDDASYESYFDDLSIFGFLEHSDHHYVQHSLMPRGIKLEPKIEGDFDDLKSSNVSLFHSNFGWGYDCFAMVDHLFFKSVFDLCGLLRFCVDKRFVYQKATVDRFLYKLFVRLFSQTGDLWHIAGNLESYMSKLSHIYETNEWGEIVEHSKLLRGSNSEGESNIHLEKMGLLNTEERMNRHRHKSFKNSIRTDSLALSAGRFAMRVFYRITEIVVEAFLKWVPPIPASCALCRLAGSLSIDVTSRIKPDKIAIAKNICTFLNTGILSKLVVGPLDVRNAEELEPLISAANVCFVNVEVTHKKPRYNSDAESASFSHTDSDKEKFPVKKELDSEITCQSEELIDNFTNMVGCVDGLNPEALDSLKRSIKENKTLQKMRFRQKLNILRKDLMLETVLLLQSANLFVHIVGCIVVGFCNHLLATDHGFLTAEKVKDKRTAHYSAGSECESVQPLIIFCKGKKRALFNAAVEFIGLAQNTVSTVIRACAAAAFRCLDYSEQYNSENLKLCGKNETFGWGEGELVSLLRELSTTKKGIDSKIKTVTNTKRPYEVFIQKAVGSSRSTNSVSNNPEDPRKSDGIDDDLRDFVDFETDQHLAMVTYCRSGKKLKTAHKLRSVHLRSEWKCLIKSYLT